MVGLKGCYNIATEEISCTACDKRVISWSHAILSQLDVSMQAMFDIIMTAKLACDSEIVRLLRNRALGNSCHQMAAKLQESHSETYLGKVARYLSQCARFQTAQSSGLALPGPPPVLPGMVAVPKYRWLGQVYLLDVLKRLDDLKAAITSIHGTILKMDSTKKVSQKLAGEADATACWATNVGNEHNQILVTVLTDSEGSHLDDMLKGLVARYEQHNVDHPKVLYIDCHCCGPRCPTKVLKDWDKLQVRLDIWHFMRRFTCGVSTESHQLFPSFMTNLSECIFEWDAEDISMLMRAKRAQLQGLGIRNPTDSDVAKKLTMTERSLHCKRRTRGAEVTKRLISDLLLQYGGDKGKDTLGVPLLDTKRIAEVWRKQQSHLHCIQDPPGVQLYLRVGTRQKHGVQLPMYRCARGTTSLECFHLHQNRFIPGTFLQCNFFHAFFFLLFF